MIKNIKAFTKKDGLRPVLEGVYITPDRIVATDTYKLIELKTDTGLKETFVFRLPSGVKDFERVEKDGKKVTLYNKNNVYITQVTKEEFPQYEMIIPKDELVSIRLSPKHLKEICTSFENKEYLDFKIYKGEYKPITIEADNLKALLMPIRK